MPSVSSAAGHAGDKSLSDSLLSEIRAVAEKPTIEQLRARLQRRAGLTPPITPAEAVRARPCFPALADCRFPLADIRMTFLLPRIWDLRHNLTAYDAAYVALAEALDAPLLTRDQRLAAAAGHHARVELV